MAIFQRRTEAMVDPRDPYNAAPEQRNAPEQRQTYEDAAVSNSMPWGWIAGGAAAVLLLLVFAFSVGTNGDRTAQNTPPATTSQSAPPAAGSRAPENTGAAPTTPAPAPRNVNPSAPSNAR
jgi:hypothetical protein